MSQKKYFLLTISLFFIISCSINPVYSKFKGMNGLVGSAEFCARYDDGSFMPGDNLKGEITYTYNGKDYAFSGKGKEYVRGSAPISQVVILLGDLDKKGGKVCAIARTKDIKSGLGEDLTLKDFSTTTITGKSSVTTFYVDEVTYLGGNSYDVKDDFSYVIQFERE